MSNDPSTLAASYFTPQTGPHQAEAARIRRAAQALRRQFSPSRQVQTDDLLNHAFIKVGDWVAANDKQPDEPVGFVRRIMSNWLINRGRVRRHVSFDDQGIAVTPPDPERSATIQRIFVELDRSPQPAIGQAMATFKLYHALGEGRFSRDWATMTEDCNRNAILREVGARLGISIATAGRHVQLIKDELKRRLEAENA